MILWSPFASASIDDGWDRINRCYLFLLLIAFAIIASVLRYESISCVGFSQAPTRYAESYCLGRGIYYMVQPEASDVHAEFNHPGGEVQPHSRVYLYPWYQYVPYYFWLLAAAYCLPYLFYRAHCGRHLRGILSTAVHLQPRAAGGSEEEWLRRSDTTATWLYYNYCGGGATLVSLARYNFFTAVTLLTKLIYVILPAVVFTLTNNMFPIGDFETYGMDWWFTNTGDMVIPDNNNTEHATLTPTPATDALFPKLAHCNIDIASDFGVQVERGTCALNANSVYQYLFLALWFALVCTMFTNVFSLVLAVVKVLLTINTAIYRKLLELMVGEGYTKQERDCHRRVYSGISGTDGRLVLFMLASTIEPRFFHDIMRALAGKMRGATGGEAGSMCGSAEVGGGVINPMAGDCEWEDDNVNREEKQQQQQNISYPALAAVSPDKAEGDVSVETTAV